MGAHRLWGAGGYHTGEAWMVTRSTRPAKTGSPLVVVAHGAGADAKYYGGAPIRWRMFNTLAAAGAVVIAADLGSVTEGARDGWGSPTQVARIGEVVTWAATEWGCNTTRVGLIGDSAGGAGALNWARANTAQLGGVVLRCGVCDIESIYQNGAGNPLLVALIDQAYAAAGGWPANRATSDPALNTSAFVPIKDRVRIYYSIDDGLVPPAGTTAVGATVGCRTIPLGAIDHDPDPYMPDEHAGAWLLARIAN